MANNSTTTPAINTGAEANNSTTTPAKDRKVKFTPDFVPGLLEDDINISVNGVRYLIPRGKESEVPECVYKEYRRSVEAAMKFHKTSERLLMQGQSNNTANESGALIT